MSPPVEGSSEISRPLPANSYSRHDAGAADAKRKRKRKHRRRPEQRPASEEVLDDDAPDNEYGPAGEDNDTDAGPHKVDFLI